MHTTKLSGYKKWLKLNKDPLAVEKNNYATKIVNAYIVYDLDASPRNYLNNFRSKNCFYYASDIVRKFDKEK